MKIAGFVAIILILIIGLFTNSKNSTKDIIQSPVSRIEITPDMVINETVYGEAEKLVDEQALIKNRETDTYKPNNTWQPPSNKKRFLPFSAVIDLGKYHFVSHIYLYDAEGTGKITISTGEPFKWKEKAVESLDRYQVWKLHPLNDTTRFIQVKLETMTSTPEILLYGVPLSSQQNKKSSVSQPPSNQSQTKPKTMDEIMGANAFIDDPIESMKAVGFIREYHSWAWDEANEQKNAFAPSYAGGGSWDFDKYYKALREAGIEVLICAQGSVDWLPGGREAKPVPPDMNSTSPASYTSHADHMYQLVARYASNQVSDGNLKLKEDQARKSGMGLVKYFENWNEPNNDWSAKENYFTPYEFAAMCSADYDGHLGTLGNDKGVKNADPKAKMVMGGIASLNITYLKAIKFWADYNRGGSIPFDIINLHHYSNNKKRARNSPVKGISPEEDSLKHKLEEVIQFRNSYMPAKEVWLTEFGYDTHPNSPQGVPIIDKMSRDEVQAIWLVRSFLAVAAAGVDRAAMYMLRDVNSDNGKQYQTSGLTTSKALGQKPKTSWYYIYTLKNSLKGMVFHKEIKTASDVFIYAFKNTDNNEKAYVVWCPTSENKTFKNYRLILDEKRSQEAQVISFVKDSISGETTTKTVDNGQLVLDISETPTIVKLKL